MVSLIAIWVLLVVGGTLLGVSGIMWLLRYGWVEDEYEKRARGIFLIAGIVLLLVGLLSLLFTL